MQPRIEIFDASNVSLGFAVAPAAGQIASIQTRASNLGGVFSFSVSGSGTTTGGYTLQVILNSAFELEGRVVGSTNDTAATAQALDDSFVTLNAPLGQAKRGAVRGTTESITYSASSVTPTFTDISTTGTRSTTAVGDDATDTLTAAQLAGFTFPLFGTNYKTLSFNTNGLITFGGALTDFANSDLSTTPALAAIAVLWDDLNIDNTGTGAASRAIFWQVVGSGASQQLIVQWNNVRQLGGTTYFTFQAVLSRDGTVQFNYASSVLTTVVTSATAGVKDAGTSNPARLLIHFNQAAGTLVGPSRSTRFVPVVPTPDWYKIDIAAGERVGLSVTTSSSKNVDIQLLATDGSTVLATGTVGATNLGNAISNVLIGVAGTYYARVTGDSNTSYSLVVTKNAAFDSEDNGTFATAQSLNNLQGALGRARDQINATALFDFESGNQGFVVNNGTTGLWHRTTYRGNERGHSSTTSFHYGREAGTLSSGQINTGSIVSSAITLPSSGPIPFSFNYILETEASTAFDTANVQLSTNNFTTFTTIASRSTNLLNSSSWRTFNTELSTFAGQIVQLRWIFNTVDAGDNDFAGWFVDDVQIGVSADDDWYSVSVPNVGDQLRFETRTPADGTGEFVNTFNPRIELYRPDGTLLTSGTVLADGRNELIQISAPIAGNFRVRVSGQNATSGEYFLGASVGSPAPSLNASVVNRQVFYNRSTSSVFGNGSGNPISAIDSSKVALLPSQTAGAANYTNYSRGLNGLIVDINGLRNATAADFQFETWDGMDTLDFVPTAALPTLTVMPGEGIGGSTRVKITFEDGAIQNTWLRVTVLANANTALAIDDVFYFGNAIADFGVGNLAGPLPTVRVNATDTATIRQYLAANPGVTGQNSVPVTNTYDVNKDGRVNATDVSIVRQNQAVGALRYFSAAAPSSVSLASQMVPSFNLLNGSTERDVAEEERASSARRIDLAIAVSGLESTTPAMDKTVHASPIAKATNKDTTPMVSVSDSDAFFSEFGLADRNKREVF